MGILLLLLKLVAIFGSAALLGNWFLTELKKSRARGEAWYRGYMTLPGIIVLLALCLPIFLKIYQKYWG